jgi:hypothetical protein
MEAIPIPATICHIPHQAAIKAMPPNSNSGGKSLGLKINTKANPEF